MSSLELSSAVIDEFRRTVWDYYRTHARDMPWRAEPTPYHVLVSELMLQQTQVSRVIPKFEAFTARYPDVPALAAAPLGDVLAIWSGLGYNRRAKFLWQAARQLVKDFDGKLPDNDKQLTGLPGIGPNTAGAILAYAYERPVTFIETNIRTVYLHHFFADTDVPVSDIQLRRLVELTRDDEHPREWYWALMDYGSFLKKTEGGRLSQSQHYRKQAPLRGSLREMRGRILRELSTGAQPDSMLRDLVIADERYEAALRALVNEGMIEQSGSTWRLTANPDAR